MTLKNNTLQGELSGDMHGEEMKRFEADSALANPAPGEEVCITGMAGRFPESDDVYQLRDNLLNKVDMVTCDSRRWNLAHPEIPRHSGKINHLQNFDAGFFGMHSRAVEMMDPLCRITLEKSVEAIMDAGCHPEELQGRNVGVFLGAGMSESERVWLYEKLESPNYGVLGCFSSMMAQQVSYYLRLKGPAMTINNACASSLYAFQQGYRAIRTGQCDMALVGGSYLCLHPLVSLQLARLGLLSLDGACKSFDEDANGYVRSESVSMLLLQKTKDAKRVYAQIIHAKANCDGFKEEGITFPSREAQAQLVREICEECNVDPTKIDYAEAHCAGTPIGDPEEIAALDEILCVNRETPLYIGSIKSNIGHSELASGITSIVKVLLCMEHDCLLPNIHYNRPAQKMKALQTGRIKVITEVTPWPCNGSGLAAINNFGFGGSNAHVLLKRPTKRKGNGSLPEDDLPRLVCFSGRTKEATVSICQDISERKLDVEFVGLLHNVFKHHIQQHPYRGYIIMAKEGELNRSIYFSSGKTSPLCLFFGPPCQELLEFGRKLLDIFLFSKTIQRIHQILTAESINLLNILKDKTQDLTNITVGSVAVQIAFVDTLKYLNLSPDYFTGYSTGELVAAYSDRALTLEQTILSACSIGRCFDNSIEKYQTEINRDFNCCSSSTEIKLDIVTTPTYKIGLCSSQYGSTIIIVKNMETCFELSNKHATKMRLDLTESLKKILPAKILKPSKWTVSFDNLKCGPAEHFVDHLLNLNDSRKAVPNQPSEAILVEVGTVGSTCFNVINLTKSNGVLSLLNCLGGLYLCGYNVDLEKLYPQVDWPVSAGTPMISPLIKWNYSKDRHVPYYTRASEIKNGARTVTIQPKDAQWMYMTGHVIDGQNLIPASGYLYMIWETYAITLEREISNMIVVFENVRIYRTVHYPHDDDVKLYVVVQKNTGNFEVTHLGQLIVSGRIYAPAKSSQELVTLSACEDSSTTLSTEDIYQELQLLGYNYKGEFRTVKECDLALTKGLVKWTGNWVTFLDGVMQIAFLQKEALCSPKLIERLAIDARSHDRYTPPSDIAVYVYNDANVIKAGGVEFRSLMLSSFPKLQPEQPLLETYRFVPLEANLDVQDAARVVAQILLENNCDDQMRILEITDERQKNAFSLGSLIQQALRDESMIQAELVELPTRIVEDKRLFPQNSLYSLVVASNFISRAEIQKRVVAVLKGSAFIISRENLDFELKISPPPKLDNIAIYKTDQESLILLHKPTDFVPSTIINMNENPNSSSWLSGLQTGKKIVVLTQNKLFADILEFHNHANQNPDRVNLKFVYLPDKEAPNFDISNDFYFKQLKKGLTVNVLKNNIWGIYRNLKLIEHKVVDQEHVLKNCSDADWIQGPLTSSTILAPNQLLAHVYYASINCSIDQRQSIEFSGRDGSGRRIMGIATDTPLSSMVVVDDLLTFSIPNEWTMEEAATVPTAYTTALLSCIIIGRLEVGDSILIHDGSSPAGQAILNVALAYKCNIFTTVNKEKRNFIITAFPEIPEHHIGDSNNPTFEGIVVTETKGRGVNLALNSFSSEQFQVSVRCLAPGGRFLGAEKRDFQSTNVQNIALDYLFTASQEQKNDLRNLMLKELKKGTIKPLTRTVFPIEESVQAFKHIEADKSTGKVIIKLRHEEPVECTKPAIKLYKAIPRFYADPQSSYVVFAKFDILGLQVVNWMISRGVRKLVLASSTSLTNGYQALKIQLWKAKEVLIETCAVDLTSKENRRKIIQKAAKLGTVEGLFNLIDQIQVTQHIDEVSRELCPKLKYFAVILTPAPKRGNIIQNRNASICEGRKAHGYPATAIQFGPIKEMLEVPKSQTKTKEQAVLPQSIESCLNALDIFLNQDEAMVSSKVIAEKLSEEARSQTVVNEVKRILGLQNLKAFSPYSTFIELGIDSMTIEDVKQTLEVEYGAMLTLQDVRCMTFARLQEMTEEKELRNTTFITKDK